ncbi:MAG TPA: LysR family transcriptional regulator [Archangium sp.]|nr:LysR family transcriptional regulator [Archangium sp.]
MLSPADMLLFAAVVREGNFTRAAQQLGLTKQTVGGVCQHPPEASTPRAGEDIRGPGTRPA